MNDRMMESISKRHPTPTEDQLRSLKEHGCESWGEYVVMMAADSGMSIGNAATLFDMLGPSEAFDGFVTSMEEAAMSGMAEEE